MSMMLPETVTEPTLRAWQALAEQAARAGGELLRSWATRFTAREKSRANLVTEADLASQEAIYNIIHAQCPEHGFLGEEGLNQPSETGFHWIIDPLDGTGNYVHSFPYYAVNIALAFHNELLVGVTYDPNRDECFSAIKDGGATVNGKPIQVSQFQELGEAFCIASLPQSRNGDSPALRRFLAVLEKAQTVQRTGSAAMNLAYVASGRLDGFWSTTLYPWDMAAGALLIQEAGGRVSRIDLSPFQVMEREIMATNNRGFHEELSSILNSF
jgi:myo-inositol-1(or 4)-monophosphatase